MRVQERLVDRLVESIRFHTTRQVERPGKGDAKGSKVLAFDELARRARQIVIVGFSESAVADGYSSTTPGNGNPGSGKGGGRTMTVPGPAGPEEVRTSSTESAAFTNLDARRGAPDPAFTIAREVLAELHTVKRALDSLANACDRFDRLRSVAQVADAPQCHVASVILGLPWDEAWAPYKRTTFVGVLALPFDEERQVCRWVYDFTRHWHRLPSKVEMLGYLERGAVRVHEPVKRR